MFLKNIRKRIILLSIILFGVGFYFFWTCLPEPLFNTPTSTVLVDRNGELLGALIAKDGQWRFPFNPSVPEKFKKSIVQFEDRRYYHHPGIDVLAIGRATWQNIQSQKVKSGGSTLTMQVIRLSRRGKKRNIKEKIMEVFMAVRLSLSHNKENVMALYASQAPFGNNVVGIDAASWRYFGKNPDQLSWAEAAMLAVLPNSPSLVHLGRNRKLLLIKRNRLLQRLEKAGEIDSTTFLLSMAEPLPDKPVPLPHYAQHLLVRTYLEQFKNKNATITLTKSSLIKNLQKQVNNIVALHNDDLKGNGINNMAALVADVETGEVLAYVGNINDEGQQEFDGQVDVITAPRSTGSILKPFLFSAMLNEGDLLPNTLIPDIPTQIAGYSPQNFNKDYDGAVPAKRALERSLNVPAVRMLRNYSYEKFHSLLKKLGMTTLSKSADNYGLSLILGGAEGTLWDIAGMYAGIARTLNHFQNNNGLYNENDIRPLTYVVTNQKQNKIQPVLNKNYLLNAASIWCTFNAMEEVSRPEIESNWKQFSSSQRIAWKTGTSFGFRDGWSVGCTPKYVVAVWVGNADGEGRPGLTGIATAAPVMFDIFKLLKNSSWFEQPYDEMEMIPVCRQSGYRALDICETKDSMWVPAVGLKTPPCPYHQIIHLDKSGKFRVNSECESTANMIHQSWFALPPAQEWFYKSRNHHYKTLPSYRKDCIASDKSSAMEFIYPKKSNQIYVPVDLDGKTGKAVFEVANRDPRAIIYWSLDEEYLGFTSQPHQMALSPTTGKHLLTITDQHGDRLEQYFEVLKK